MTQANFVERWEQALRLLENMTPHERENHFDMGTWGVQTECGTVACLAGHCALDPWFQERGFSGVLLPGRTMDFTESIPCEFFGDRGYDFIFLSAEESYEGIVRKVKEHIEYLKAGGDPDNTDDAWDDEEEDDDDIVA